MEKSALTTERINIQLDDIRKESRRRLYESKEKNGKSVPTETEYPIIETAEKVSSIRKWSKRKTVIVGNSLLAEIEEKRISGNRSVKARISPPATTHYMYDYLKPLLKENPDNFIFHDASNDSVNETSRDILNEILYLKHFIEKLCPTCKVIVSNLIYQSVSGKTSLTIKNVNDHLDAVNTDVAYNNNICGNYLNINGLPLNSTEYGKLALAL